MLNFKLGSTEKVTQFLTCDVLPFNEHRMTNACQKKCINTNYSGSELEKGESVCLDRCVAKYLDIHDRIGKQLTQQSQATGE